MKMLLDGLIRDIDKSYDRAVKSTNSNREGAMPVEANVVHFAVKVDAGDEADAEQVDRLKRELGSEIRELGAESVAFPTGTPAPEGSKGFVIPLPFLPFPLPVPDPVVVGIAEGLSVKLIELLIEWVKRQQPPLKLVIPLVGKTFTLGDELRKMPPEAETKLVREISSALTSQSGGTPEGK
jgi:hypothetical protein